MSAYARLPRDVRRFCFGVVATTAATFLLVALLEGGASLFVLGREILHASVSEAERRHKGYAQYDPELGWTNRPRTILTDVFGPGASVHIDRSGFRATADVTPAVPAGRIRALCSGDSFTFGYGVDDEWTWCHRLEKRAPDLETVNLGVAGYGIDQSYLRYERVRASIPHQVHLVAFIADDFVRVSRAVFFGYPKPVLHAKDGDLVVGNVPTPHPFLPPGAVTEMRLALSRLRLSGLLGVEATPARAAERHPDEHASWPVVSRVFAHLQEEDATQGVELVLLFLPTERDYDGTEATRFRELTAQFAAEHGITYIDLIPELRKLPRAEVRNLYLQPGETEYIGAAGHLNAAGNEWVAKTVYDHLQPQLLAAHGSSTGGTRTALGTGEAGVRLR